MGRPAALRAIYTLQGIIKPVVVAEGRCIATWGVRKGRVWLCPFETDSAAALNGTEELLPADGLRRDRIRMNMQMQC